MDKSNNQFPDGKTYPRMTETNEGIAGVINLNSQMMHIALEIQALAKIREEIPAQGIKTQASPVVISAMMQDAAESISLLIKQHRALSKQSFEALRAFEIRDAKPIDFTHKQEPVFSLSAHNSAMAKEYEVSYIVSPVNSAA